MSLLSNDFDAHFDEDDAQRLVWLALVKNAWRRYRDFVVLRAEDEAERDRSTGASP